MSDNVFRKTRRDADPDFFAAEAAGLRWLAQAGAPVVEVLACWDSGIELHRLTSTAPDREAAGVFGAALARMHDAGADAFGSPPTGYTGRQFIGERPLSSRTHDRWGEFYAVERVQPYLEPARRAGFLNAADEALTRQACDAIAEGAFDDDEPPRRLHGDLWSGNVIWTPDGVVMIDPAAHGGHRETDLAMLALFGCPQLETIVSAYDETTPLAPGWRDRVPLHQLHPLAVHAAGHGPSYGAELGRAARATLALLR
ncbi:fructosamine kinase family protein [Gordonia sp. DT30]|uniref:fructosamine kinase family protein n=1 Tax=unclassified Gordonia (in: high G+C Gram-positive bacteria) TaxID=2657482 RepID=UPI003CF666D5